MKGGRTFLIWSASLPRGNFIKNLIHLFRKRRPACGNSLINYCTTRVHAHINWPGPDLRGH
ncbi:hypothetical protein E2C01_073341 [Portunus trituberculatus]|uniref:Uncharacterized protein n=1 Tax=Portunus trituberculatus TaxID=210409 RepID=A0A5B7I971_PORTR|nr:hypothetical protein [Portunus trituberculatus]